jgi:aminoglycoside phosphotransferase (APT) family kinase protein
VPRTVVLRIARNNGGVEREALVLPILKRLGLPVPSVLSPPERDPSMPDLYAMMVTEFLAGDTLQDWSERGAEGLKIAEKLGIEAIAALHRVPDEDSLRFLPRRSLLADLMALEGSPWVGLPEMKDAFARLERTLRKIELPLVFSNGDYQPANFLSNGGSLAGILDFEKAAFVDPLSVLARYPVYDLMPLSRSRFVERFLEREGFTPQDFAPRIAVFCLRTLHTKSPLSGESTSQTAFRNHVLAVLQDALKLIG